MLFWKWGVFAMISLQTGELLKGSIEELLIPSERVAHVQVGNSLEHALLVLSKSGYTAVPVLDPKYKLHGLISTPLIMDAIMGIERIEFEKLDQIKVEEVSDKTTPVLKIYDSFSKGLKSLINHPFVCVENEKGIFEGILTRRAMLKKLNSYLQKINYQYE